MLGMLDLRSSEQLLLRNNVQVACTLLKLVVTSGGSHRRNIFVRLLHFLGSSGPICILIPTKKLFGGARGVVSRCPFGRYLSRLLGRLDAFGSETHVGSVYRSCTGPNHASEF